MKHKLEELLREIQSMTDDEILNLVKHHFKLKRSDNDAIQINLLMTRREARGLGEYLLGNLDYLWEAKQILDQAECNIKIEN